MEAPDFLPLGSIVVIRGNTKKLMIISRGVAVLQDEGQRYYDYGACLYPEGLMGDTVVYFNHEGIQKVVWEGYTNEDNEWMLENLRDSLRYVTIAKGNPAPVKDPRQE